MLYFEFENELKFYNLKARLSGSELFVFLEKKNPIKCIYKRNEDGKLVK